MVWFRRLRRLRRPSIRAGLLRTLVVVNRLAGPAPSVGRSSRLDHARTGRHGRSRRLPGRRGGRAPTPGRLADGRRRSCATRARLRRSGVTSARAAIRCRRQQVERIQVAVRVCSETNPQMDIRTCQLRRPARADGSDGVLLGDRHTLRDEDRAEMRERDGVAVRRLDRDRLAARRNSAGEADRARCGRDNRLPRCVGSDVHAAMLPGRVGMRFVEGERLQHRPSHRPTPRIRPRRPDEEDHQREDDAKRECFQLEQQEARIAPPDSVVKSAYNDRL